MKLFTKDFPDKIKLQILTSDVVAKKVKLKAKGKEFEGLCPFHNEKTPSFTVNNQKGFYHCFGCGSHGDIISFVMNTEKISYQDAIIELANRFGITIPIIEKNPSFDNKDKEILLSINNNALDYFKASLLDFKSSNAIKYLHQRGIDDKIIDKFNIGFAPNSYQQIIDYLRGKSFKDSDIAKSGLVGNKDNDSSIVNNKSNYTSLYAKFRNRIIFPIFNEKNQVIAFGGRSLNGEMPKYLNSPETLIFRKKEILFNYNLAKSEIIKKDYAILVEGYIDAISLFKNNIKNVVAGLGTAINQQHLINLAKITKKIIICLDGDNAGIRASRKIIDLALPIINPNLNICFLILPNQLDPDDFVNKFGPERLQLEITNALNLSQFCWQQAVEEFTNHKNPEENTIFLPEIKAKIEEFLNLKLSLINNQITKKHFKDFFNNKLFYLNRHQFQKKSTILPNIDLTISGNVNNYKNTSLNIIKNIAALIIKFPQLIYFKNDDFKFYDLIIATDEANEIKDYIVDFIDSNSSKYIDEKEDINPDFLLSILNSSDYNEIINIIKAISYFDIEIAKSKFYLLLLKDLLLKITNDCNILSPYVARDSIITTKANNNDDNIFIYKMNIEKKILLIENEILSLENNSF